MYELLGNQILEVITVNNAIIKKHYGMEHKIKITADKTDVTLNEVININFSWHKFNTESEDWLPDTENQEPFQVNIDGEKLTLPIGETLEFSSAEPGPVTIKTENPGVDNVALEVLVNAV